ncbi:MAG: cytochrome c [Actinobacteria bacterium]|nr:cytochrome c [Actinomycetota bacterium]
MARKRYVSRRCANCHGAGGGGGTGPKLSDGQVIIAYPDPADQRLLIANGRNAMPSFSGSLSSAELDAVVRYTREVLSSS